MALFEWEEESELHDEYPKYGSAKPEDVTDENFHEAIDAIRDTFADSWCETPKSSAIINSIMDWLAEQHPDEIRKDLIEWQKEDAEKLTSSE